MNSLFAGDKFYQPNQYSVVLKIYLIFHRVQEQIIQSVLVFVIIILNLYLGVILLKEIILQDFSLRCFIQYFLTHKKVVSHVIFHQLTPILLQLKNLIFMYQFYFVNLWILLNLYYLTLGNENINEVQKI